MVFERASDNDSQVFEFFVSPGREQEFIGFLQCLGKPVSSPNYSNSKIDWQRSNAVEAVYSSSSSVIVAVTSLIAKNCGHSLDDDGLTALQMAAARGNQDVVALLCTDEDAEEDDVY